MILHSSEFLTLLKRFRGYSITGSGSGFRGYSIIGSGSGFTVNLGSDSLGKSNDLGVSSVSRIHFGFEFIMNPDPEPIIK